MKKPILFNIVSLFSLVLLGCNTLPPKPVKPDRPEWISNEPGEHNGKMSFVGVSTFASTEQSARGNAWENATDRAVKYLGTKSTGKVVRIAKTFGLKGDTINETISGRSFKEQLYKGLVRRLESKIWYLELKYDAEKEVAYKSFVLAEIPTVELDYAIEEAIREAAEEERRKEQAIIDAELFIKKRINSAKSFGRKGDLFTAIKKLEELQPLAQILPVIRRGVYLAEANDLKANWLGSIDLISKSGNYQHLEPSQTPKPLKVQVVMQPDNESIPIRNFPVVFWSKQNQDVHILTDKNGVASLELPPFKKSGKFIFVASLDPDQIQETFSKDNSKNLLGRKANFSVSVAASFLKDRINNDFELEIKSITDGNYTVGKEGKLLASCAKRCRVRVYVWDGNKGILAKVEGARKWIKGEKYELLIDPESSPGKYTLITLSTTGKFPDAVKRGTTYSSTEFAVVLKNFRNLNAQRAEEHLEFTVNKN